MLITAGALNGSIFPHWEEAIAYIVIASGKSSKPFPLLSTVQVKVRSEPRFEPSSLKAPNGSGSDSDLI